MAHLYNMYSDACVSVTKGISDHAADPAFLQFVFRNKSRIVLETLDCIASEEEVLSSHGIPKAVSDGVLKCAEAERQKNR